MNDESVTLPRHLQIFLEAVRPVRSRLYGALEQRVARGVEPLDFPGCLYDLFGVLERFAQNLDCIVNDRIGKVVQRNDVSKDEILGAVRDFERELDSLLSAYQSVRALKVCGDDALARGLMEEVYLHLLHQIRGWLDELVEVLSDPLGSIKKRGLPTSGYVEIPINLTLTPAPQFAKLAAWANAQREKIGARTRFHAAFKPDGLGLLGTLGVMWLGWEIGEHLFGKDDD
ncbi:MAG: hypothetical protein FD134_2396 [Gallionellaceae bacterium]|nr:MAG: hypothetical protein FD134_2396 [Gallionellaceae bacterium]